MRKSLIARGLLILLFAALLAAPFAFRRWHGRGEAGARADAAPDVALARHGFRLEEVSKSAGINFTHTAPRLDAKLGHIMPQVASMGAAVSVVDFDRDGWQDLYATNSGEGSHNALYRNNGDGTFGDVAAALGVADVNRAETGISMGAVWGDYDNDGYEDLFLYKWGRPELFHNDAGRGFTRATEGANLPAWVNANTALWFDYDRDGRLDLFLGGYYPEDVNLWRLKTTRVMPESFEYARNGGRKYLLKGRGDGTFEDVTAEAGIDTRRWALASAAADLRGTGYPDLFIANDYGVSELFFNDAGRRFRDMGEQTGVGFAPKSGMNVAFGDVLNRGAFAAYVTNISEDGVLVQGNNLWVPREGTGGDALRYDNLAEEMGVELGGWSFGAQFGDLNNDG
ncbi:MAG TPA: VCBS repeat-containing protein, partial [Pyrinomonadaceae bacterium]